MKWIINILILFFPALIWGQKKMPAVVNSEIIINYADSTVKASIYLRNIKFKPKIYSVYYWYNSNQINKNMGGYSGRILDGSYKVFDLNNNLICQGLFKKGLKDGTWKRWNNKGGLVNYNNYSYGKLTGKAKSFNRNGNLIFDGKYKNGLKNGKCKVLINDSLKTVFYKNDIEKKRKLTELFSSIFKKDAYSAKNTEQAMLNDTTNVKIRTDEIKKDKVNIDESNKAKKEKVVESNKVKKRPNKVKSNVNDERKPELLNN